MAPNEGRPPGGGRTAGEDGNDPEQERGRSDAGGSRPSRSEGRRRSRSAPRASSPGLPDKRIQMKTRRYMDDSGGDFYKVPNNEGGRCLKKDCPGEVPWCNKFVTKGTEKCSVCQSEHGWVVGRGLHLVVESNGASGGRGASGRNNGEQDGRGDSGLVLDDNAAEGETETELANAGRTSGEGTNGGAATAATDAPTTTATQDATAAPTGATDRVPRGEYRPGVSSRPNGEVSSMSDGLTTSRVAGQDGDHGGDGDSSSSDEGSEEASSSQASSKASSPASSQASTQASMGDAHANEGDVSVNSTKPHATDAIVSESDESAASAVPQEVCDSSDRTSEASLGGRVDDVFDSGYSLDDGSEREGSLETTNSSIRAALVEGHPNGNAEKEAETELANTEGTSGEGTNGSTATGATNVPTTTTAQEATAGAAASSQATTGDDAIPRESERLEYGHDVNSEDAFLSEAHVATAASPPDAPSIAGDTDTDLQSAGEALTDAEFAARLQAEEVPAGEDVRAATERALAAHAARHSAANEDDIVSNDLAQAEGGVGNLTELIRGQFISLLAGAEMLVVHVSAVQGRNNQSGNGCVVIAALVVSQSLAFEVVSDDDLVRIIDISAGPLLEAVRSKFRLEAGSFTTIDEVVGHMYETTGALQQSQFLDRFGGNVLDDTYLEPLKTSLLSPGVGRISALFFFHSHVVALRVIRDADGNVLIELVDSLTRGDWRGLGHPMTKDAVRVRCNMKHFFTLVRFYCLSRYEEVDRVAIDSKPWSTADQSADLRTFEAYVYCNRNAESAPMEQSSAPKSNMEEEEDASTVEGITDCEEPSSALSDTSTTGPPAAQGGPLPASTALGDDGAAVSTPCRGDGDGGDGVGGGGGRRDTGEQGGPPHEDWNAILSSLTAEKDNLASSLNDAKATIARLEEEKGEAASKLSSLEAQIQEKSEDDKALSEATEASNAQIAQLTAQASALEQERDALTRRVEEAVAEISDLKSTVTALTTERDDASAKAAKAVDLEATVATKDQEIGQLNEQLASLTNRLAEASNHDGDSEAIESLKKETEELKSLLSSANASVEEARSAALSADQELDSALRNLAKHDEARRIAEKARRIAEEKLRLAELQTDSDSEDELLKEMEDLCNDANQTVLADMKREIAGLEATILQKDQVATALNKKLASSAARVEELETEVSTLSTARDDAAREVEEGKASLAEAMRTLTEKEERIKTLEKSKLTNKIAKRIQTLQAKANECDSLRAALDEVNASLESAIAEKAELEGQLSRLEATILQKDQEANSLNEKLASSAARVEELETEVSTLSTARDDAAREVEEGKASLAEAMRTLTEKEERIKTLEKSKLTSEIKNDIQTLQAKADECDSAVAEKAELEGQLSRLEATILQKDQEAAVLNEKLVSSAARVKELETEVSTLSTARDDAAKEVEEGKASLAAAQMEKGEAVQKLEEAISKLAAAEAERDERRAEAELAVAAKEKLVHDMEALESKHADALGDIAKEVDSLKLQISETTELTNQVSTLSAENGQLKTTIESLTTERDAANEDRDAALQKLQSKLSEVARESKEHARALDEAKASLQAAVAEKVRLEADHESRLTKLGNDRDGLSAKAKSAEKRLAQVARKTRELLEDMGIQQQDSDATDHLPQYLGALQENIEGLQEQLRRYREGWKRLKGQLNQAERGHRQRCEQLQGEMAGLQDNIAQLEVERNDLQDRLAQNEGARNEGARRGAPQNPGGRGGNGPVKVRKCVMNNAGRLVPGNEFRIFGTLNKAKKARGTAFALGETADPPPISRGLIESSGGQLIVRKKELSVEYVEEDEGEEGPDRAEDGNAGDN